MNVKLVCVGKLKEKYLKAASEEYKKRLGRFCTLETVEVADEKAPETLSLAQAEAIKAAEGRRVLAKIEESEHVIALDIKGESLDSPGFALKLSQWMDDGKRRFCFIIGGSLGLSDDVKNRADYILSFSNMTFPHQLFRIMLLEQIYRAFKLINNEPYHK